MRVYDQRAEDRIISQCQGLDRWLHEDEGSRRSAQVRLRRMLDERLAATLEAGLSSRPARQSGV